MDNKGGHATPHCLTTPMDAAMEDAMEVAYQAAPINPSREYLSGQNDDEENERHPTPKKKRAAKKQTSLQDTTHL